MRRLDISRARRAAAIAVTVVMVLALPAAAQPPVDNYVDLAGWLGSLLKGDDRQMPAGVGEPNEPGVRVEGTLVFFTDQAAFEAAAPGLPLEDFEAGNVPPGGVTSCSDPYNSTTNDACWSPGDIEAGLGIGSSSGTGTVILGAGFPGVGNTSIVTGANTFTDSTDALFSNPDTFAVGLELLPGFAPSDTIDISIFGAGNVLLGTTTATAVPPGAFWGVIADETITRININSPAGNGTLIDNVQFGTGAPALIIADTVAVDLCVDPGSNQNDIIEPGEGLELSIELLALGGDFTGISGVLSSPSPGITIVQGTAAWPDLSDGTSAFGSAPFTIELSPDVPCFTTFDLVLDVTSVQDDFQFTETREVGQALAPDVPLDIPDGDPLGIESALVVAQDVTLADLNVRVEITHTWVGDLFISLRSPVGTEVVLLDRPGFPASPFGCSDDNMNVTFDDDSAMTNLEDWCPGSTPWFVGDGAPVGSLAAFNGESTAGTWTLFVSDNAGADTGTIVDWELITDPTIGGVCGACNDSGLAPEPEVPVTEIPTLAPYGLVLLVAGLLGAGFAFLRRRR